MIRWTSGLIGTSCRRNRSCSVSEQPPGPFLSWSFEASISHWQPTPIPAPLTSRSNKSKAWGRSVRSHLSCTPRLHTPRSTLPASAASSLWRRRPRRLHGSESLSLSLLCPGPRSEPPDLELSVLPPNLSRAPPLNFRPSLTKHHPHSLIDNCNLGHAS